MCQVQQDGVWPSWRPLQAVQEDRGAGRAASSLLLCTALLWSPLWAEVFNFISIFHLKIFDPRHSAKLHTMGPAHCSTCLSMEGRK